MQHVNIAPATLDMARSHISRVWTADKLNAVCGQIFVLRLDNPANAVIVINR
jgi:hypothetical protein